MLSASNDQPNWEAFALLHLSDVSFVSMQRQRVGLGPLSEG